MEITVYLFTSLVLLAICSVTDARGHPRMKKTKRVVNGNLADRPFFVRIFVTQSDGDAKSCGGTMIKRNWVLTTASCLEGGVFTPEVRVGDFSEFPRDKPKRYMPQDKGIHKHENRKGHKNDLALLEMAEEIVLKGSVLPVCNSMQIEFSSGGMGFNLPSSDWYTRKFKEYTAQDMAPYECAFDTDQWDPDMEICLQSEYPGRNSCNHDKGNPVYAMADKKPVCLYGVITAVGKNCEGASLAARLLKYDDWISKVLSGKDEENED